MKRLALVLLLVGNAFSLPNVLNGDTTSRWDISSPNYYILGFGSKHSTYSLLTGHNNQVKFRINVNYRLVGWISNQSGIYFGYNQMSFWNLWDPSSPFLDNNYSPEGFLYFDANSLKKPKNFLPSLKLAFKHESNGRDGDADRSWNRVIATANFAPQAFDYISGSLSVWYAVTSNPDRPTIRRYMGDGQLSVDFKLPCIGLGLSIVSRYVFGYPYFANVETDLYFQPFRTRFKTAIHWAPAFMLQYFYGTGECMLKYDDVLSELRVGIAFL